MCNLSGCASEVTKILPVGDNVARSRARARTHTHTHTHTHKYTHTNTRTHTQTRTHVHTHTHMRAYTRTNAVRKTETGTERQGQREGDPFCWSVGLTQRLFAWAEGRLDEPVTSDVKTRSFTVRSG